MVVNFYKLTKTNITIERITALINSIPCFMFTEWEDIENVPIGEQFDLTLECRYEDLRTVERIITDLV